MSLFPHAITRPNKGQAPNYTDAAVKCWVIFLGAKTNRVEVAAQRLCDDVRLAQLYFNSINYSSSLMKLPG